MLNLIPPFLLSFWWCFCTNIRRNSEPAGAFASSNALALPTDSAAVGVALSSTSVLPPFDLKEFWEEEDAWVHSLTEDLAPRSSAVPAPVDLTEFWEEDDAWVQSLTVSTRSASHTSPAAAASASSRSPDEIRVADQLELTEKKKRKFKWGECQCGKYSVTPWIFKSGRRKGALKLVCRSFFKRENRCWLTQDFDMTRFPEIPKPMRDLYQSLEMSFERNARQGS